MWVPALQPVDVDLWSGVCDVCASSFFLLFFPLFFTRFCARRGRSISDAYTYTHKWRGSVYQGCFIGVLNVIGVGGVFAVNLGGVETF